MTLRPTPLRPVRRSLPLLTTLCALLAGCAQDKPSSTVTAPDPDQGKTFSQQIGADGGRLDSASGGVALEVPAGALDADQQISVAIEAPTAETASSVYDFGPDGLHFAKPVTITIAFSASLPADEEAALATLRDNTWSRISSSRREGDRVIGSIEHFSRYAVVLYKVASSGDGGARPDVATRDAVIVTLRDSAGGDAPTPDASLAEQGAPDVGPDARLPATMGCFQPAGGGGGYYCEQDSDCTPHGLNICKTSFNRCAECLDDSHCVAGPGNTGKCENQWWCVRCEADADCTASGLGARCNTTSQRCVECLADADCSHGPSDTGRCDTLTNQCRRCSVDTDCQGTGFGPYCDTARELCGACRLDSHCVAGPESSGRCYAGACIGCESDGDCWYPKTQCREAYAGE